MASPLSCSSSLLLSQRQRPLLLLLPSHRLRLRCSGSPSPPPPPSPLSLLLSVPDWADAVTERGMRKRRQLYDADAWRRHRSSRRHLRHVLSGFSSRVIVSLIPPVSSFAAVAALIAAYNSAVAAGWLPGYFPLLRAPSLPYQLTAPALALLLVFRTEASYARYVEGRKAWMGVISHTSELAGMVLSMHVDEGSEDARTKKALLNYIMAFPVALKCHVLSGSDARSELKRLLDEDDLEVVLSSRHRPRCIIEFISQSFQVLGMAETKRNMLVGVLIEEPFPVLALDELCHMVHSNIQEAMGIQNSIKRSIVKNRRQHLEWDKSNGSLNL